MERFGIIYKITNLVNGKVYIGQTTKTMEARWEQHCYPRGKNCRLLGRAVKKYGKENFKVEILATVSWDQMDDVECRYIKECNSIYPNGYNFESGGHKNKKLSEGQRQKIRDANSGFRCKQPGAKRVTCMDIATGIEWSYPNMSAADEDGFCHVAISGVVKGIEWSHKGKRWKLADSILYPEVKLSRSPSGVRFVGKSKKSYHVGIKPGHKTPIQAEHLLTKEKIKFDSIKSAIASGFEKTQIHRCIAGQKIHHKGFSWSYQDGN